MNLADLKIKLSGNPGSSDNFDNLSPWLKKHKWHLLTFVLLFALFFAANWYAIRFPEILRRNFNRSPFVHMAYSDADMSLFPPSIEMKNPVLSGPLLRGASLRFERLRVSFRLLPLLTAKLGLSFTGIEGDGHVQLDVATGRWAEFNQTFFDLEIKDLSMNVAEAFAQFDPDAKGRIDAVAKGEIHWMNAGGQFIPKESSIEASGEMRLESVRNEIVALNFDRFRKGVFVFDISIAGRAASIKRMNFTDQSCGANVAGKAVLDWRNMADTELNLHVEVKARAADISPVLMNDTVRQRLDSGQTLPFSIQGPLRNVQMKPVF